MTISFQCKISAPNQDLIMDFTDLVEKYKDRLSNLHIDHEDGIMAVKFAFRVFDIKVSATNIDDDQIKEQYSRDG